MLRNRVPSRAQVLTDDAGQSSPTPLFVAFVATLVLSAMFAFRGGITERAAFDFLVLAATVSVTVLATFGGLLVWSTRQGHRVSSLSSRRPGAIVVRGTRALGLTQATKALRTEVPILPMGLTFLADTTGVELWAGAAEHPLRLGRAPWEAVGDIRVTRVTRWGRGTGGITVVVHDGEGGAPVELPFAVTGSGLGGLFAPPHAELEALVETLRDAREQAYALR